MLPKNQEPKNQEPNPQSGQATTHLNIERVESSQKEIIPGDIHDMLSGLPPLRRSIGTDPVDPSVSDADTSGYIDALNDFIKNERWDIPPIINQVKHHVPYKLRPESCPDPILKVEVQKDWNKAGKRLKPYTALKPLSLFYDCCFLDEEWVEKIKAYVKTRGYLASMRFDYRVGMYIWYALERISTKHPKKWIRNNLDGEPLEQYIKEVDDSVDQDLMVRKHQLNIVEHHLPNPNRQAATVQYVLSVPEVDFFSKRLGGPKKVTDL